MPPAPPTSRPSTWPSPAPTSCSTPTRPSASYIQSKGALPHRRRHHRVLRLPWGRGPSTPWSRRTRAATPAELAWLDVRTAGSPGSPSLSPQGDPPVPAAAPSLSAGGGPGPADHRRRRLDRRRPAHLRQGRRHRAVDVDPRALHHRHPAPTGRRRRGHELPLRQPTAATASRSRRPPWSCCGASASRPARRWGTCPAPTTPSPTSTR